ncbi:MAG: hypothetical protein ACK40G_17820 [Cytophagaceae bacterium]
MQNSIINPKIIIKGKTAFYLFLLTSAIVIITVWLTGLNIHRTISENALYSLSIITFIFFTFISYGLYKGIGLSDNFGQTKSKITVVEPTGIVGDVPLDKIPVGDFASEGLEGILIGIIMWIGILLLSVLLVFFFETVVLAGLTIFSGLLYWVFYRATRLVLRYSKFTKNNLAKSMGIALRYSLMYSGWVYAIIFLLEYFKK